MELVDEVGLVISATRPVGLSRITSPECHCSFVGYAREGRAFYTQNEDISCPLARFNLGLDQVTPERLGELARTLVSWSDAQNEEIALRYLKSAVTIDVSKKYICHFPMENTKMAPDIVVKIGSPEEFMPILRTITRLSGRRVQGVASGVGAMCGDCTAIPMVTGRPNISLGCGGSRPHARLAPDQLLLALPIEPYRLLHSIRTEAAW
ncbi:MAG: DUF169 domain-containing protein [Desulfobacteraceae bacterium]|nr:DUF169 domain-containing protein [Desulfobacteraceae bacterium]